MKKTIFILVFMLVNFCLLACSCSKLILQPVDSGFVYSQVVFRGKVISILEEGIYLNDHSPLTLINFEIFEGMRGIKSEVSKLTLVSNGDMGCEYSFTVGKEYIVFAHYTGMGLLRTSICAHTNFVEKFSNSDLKKLEYATNRYNDNFDLTYRGWADGKVERNPQKKLEVELLRAENGNLVTRATAYKYFSLVVGLWAIFCSGWLVYKHKLPRKP